MSKVSAHTYRIAQLSDVSRFCHSIACLNPQRVFSQDLWRGPVKTLISSPGERFKTTAQTSAASAARQRQRQRQLAARCERRQRQEGRAGQGRLRTLADHLKVVARRQASCAGHGSMKCHRVSGRPPLGAAHDAAAPGSDQRSGRGCLGRLRLVFQTFSSAQLSCQRTSCRLPDTLRCLGRQCSSAELAEKQLKWQPQSSAGLTLRPISRNLSQITLARSGGAMLGCRQQRTRSPVGCHQKCGNF